MSSLEHDTATARSAGSARVADGILRLSVPTHWPIGPVNLYLIEDDPLTLVDAGPRGSEPLAAVEAALEACGHTMSDIGLIVLTHEHPDHAGLAQVLAERAGAEVAALRDLAAGLASYDEFMAAQEAHATALMLRHGVRPEDAETATATLRADHACAGVVHVTYPLIDGGQLELRNRSFRIMHRPGHSEWDTLLYDDAARVLISGDHLLAEAPAVVVVPTGSPRLDRPRKRPLLALRRSLEEVARLAPRIVLGGHGDPVTEVSALVARRLNEQDSRAQRLLDLVGTGSPTAHDLATQVFGADARRHAFLTMCQVLSHLDLLLDRGVAVETVENGVARFSRA